MTGVGATLENSMTAPHGMPGVVQIVRNGNFIGVVAEREEGNPGVAGDRGDMDTGRSSTGA